MYKILLHIKYIFAGVFNNYIRFFLTLVGISTGIFIYLQGNIIIESFYNTQAKEIEIIPENAFFLKSEKIENEILSKYFYEPQSTFCLERVSDMAFVIYEKYKQEKSIIISAKLIEVSSPTNIAVTYNSMYGYNMTNLEIVAGRLLTQEEINSNSQVCVIDEFTKELLFDDADPIGEYIYFNKYTGGVIHEGEDETENIKPYRVVGVVKNSYYTNKNKAIFDSNFLSGELFNYVSVDIICPYNASEVITNNLDDSMINYIYLWNCKNNQKKIELLNKIKASSKLINDNNDYCEVIDKNSKIEKIEKKLQPIKIGIKIIILGLQIISCIAISSITFYSMKDRCEEIGIKKAFGASWLTILFDFIIENIIISFFAFEISMFLCIFSSKEVEKTIQLYFDSFFEINYSSFSIVNPLIISLIFGIIATIIPCIRFSMMPVAKSIRIE